MEEESGVKVTRLRRRLSVESEGTQSPATPSTPTKKRASKLAKPALELIDENVNENMPKRATRKSIARDVVEPADEKAVTPSRRSTRIRSNTSLVLETMTQSVVESPRARRAIRRNSQLGSDTETATTPARQARRTRKDSTSSVEKLAVTNSSEKTTVQVAEAITEEPDKEIVKNDKDDKTDERSPPVRKSPRLNQKSKNSLDEAVKDINGKQPQKKLNGQVYEEPLNTNDDKANNVESVSSEKDKISNSSANLISEISSSPKKTTNLNKTAPAIEDFKNENNKRKRVKSCTSNQPRDETNLDKNDLVGLIKNSIKNDIMSPKKYINKSDSEFNASGENKENMQSLKSVNFLNATDTIKVLENTSTKDIQSMVFMEDSDSNSGSIGKLTMDIPDDVQVQHGADDQCVPVVEPTKPKRSSASESFSVEPMDIDETIPENVTLNDFSDKTNSSREEDNLRDTSHNDSKIKTSLSNENSMVMNKSSNKCSTSVTQELQHSKRKSSITPSEENNNESIVVSDETEKSKRKLSLSKTESENNNHKSSDTEDSYKATESVNNPKRQSLLSNNETENSKVKPPDTSQASDNEKINDSTNKSKRKSSLSNDKFKTADISKAEDDINNSANISKSKAASETTESQTLDNSCNENKSTLVLSQLKDMSANEKIRISKSPNDTKNELSNSGIISDKTKKKVKQNLSQDYLTSTPLQQRHLQKLAMPINTSIIGPESKNASKVDLTPENRSSKVAEESDTSDNDLDENSENKSKIIDDEAGQASDDYESGDSRNEEEREYEKQHDISEKGVTLESEEDISNDTDYEKDSFIVSSNEEDDNLLSGSGDDLSLSDNELKMTAKSKKKYDGRKRKEQKKASKEMYEARHKINESDKSSKSKHKIYKRQRLDSSLQESEKEDSLPKTKKHSKIDSSLDKTTNCSNVDESIRIKKKKTKRLSSFCDDNAEPNEKEITVNAQNVSDNDDPLSAAIKLEPKTPQKDISISTIQINHNIENVNIDSNASLIKPNETSDPLQVTSANDYEDSDSDISENLEIISNYDSVLENLNKNNKQKKIKTLDASLNVNKKIKHKTKEPIVDQLNLTQTKISKKKKAQKAQEFEITVEVPKARDVAANSPEIDGGDISDSIDMRLLFPEDSNDSEVNASTFKTNTTTDANQTEKLIPLKRTEAKTNIRESMGANVSKNESELNVSKKKNLKSSENMPESTDEPEETNLSFFIDTKGTYDDTETSTQNSNKKNKKQKQTITGDMQNESLADTADTTNPENALLDISIMSDKKKKKHKKNDTSTNIEQDTTLDVSQNEKRKSRKTSEGAVENKEIDNTKPDKTHPEDELLDVSIISDKKKKKHKNNNISTNMEQESTLNISQNGTKKSKKTSESAVENNETDNDNPDNANFTNISELIPQENPVTSYKKKKKNKHLDMSANIEETSEAPSMSQSGKKKSKKTSESMMENNETDKSYTDNANLTYISELLPQENPETSNKKKKKNKHMDMSANIEETSEAPSMSQSGKKISKKTSESLMENNETDKSYTETTPQEQNSVTNDKKKKKNKNMEVSINVEEVLEAPSISLSGKKKSKKSSETIETDNAVADITIAEVSLNVSLKSDKKKKKNNDTTISMEQIIVESASNSAKKNKKLDEKGEQNQSHSENLVSEVTKENETPNNDKKKKKNKSADVSETVSEVTTENETPNNDKKKKKKNKKNKSADVSQTVSEVTTENETPNNDKKKKKKNKKNKSADVSQTETITTGGADTGSGKKKRNKKKKNNNMHQSEADNQNAVEGIPKKRKRENPSDPTVDAIDEMKISIKKKKRKMSQNDDEDDDAPTEERISYIGEVRPIDIKTPEKKTKKKSKNKPTSQLQASSQDDSKKKAKKRKATDDNDGQKKSKVFKENLFDEVHVPRLPESIINQLGDKPSNISEKQKKIKAISTAPFQVEEAKKRKNKPSNYLEQSIYLNDETPVKDNKKPQKLKNPKVLPFVPTAITSGKGYTSNFKINLLPQDTEFVAQASGTTNFKNDYLSNQRIKKFRTFEQFKKQRSHKISKF